MFLNRLSSDGIGFFLLYYHMIIGFESEILWGGKSIDDLTSADLDSRLSLVVNRNYIQYLQRHISKSKEEFLELDSSMDSIGRDFFSDMIEPFLSKLPLSSFMSASNLMQSKLKVVDEIVDELFNGSDNNKTVREFFNISDFYKTVRELSPEDMKIILFELYLFVVSCGIESSTSNYILNGFVVKYDLDQMVADELMHQAKVVNKEMNVALEIITE